MQFRERTWHRNCAKLLQERGIMETVLKISKWRLATPMQTKDIFSKALLTRIWTTCWLKVFVALLLVCPVSEGEEPLVLPVWPGTVPGDYGAIGPERVRASSEAPIKDAKW